MKKGSLKYIVIAVLLILLCYRCSTSVMPETNVLAFEFKTQDSPALNTLRVNLYLMSSYRASEWYGYEKKITVIDQGKVLSDFKSKYIFYYQVIAMNQKGGVYYDDQGQDNIFARRADIIEHYNFNAKNIEYTLTIKDGFIIGHSQSHGIIEYDALDAKARLQLPFYDPKTAKFELSDLSESSLEELKNKNMDDLLQVEKLKEQDILKLTQLSTAQKQTLIQAHALKSFDPPPS